MLALNTKTPTAQQQRAIDARGNVLVVAGAGAGKTQTVIDRCLAWLLNEGSAASIDQVLMVTFTNAAAAEMRQRLRGGLEAAQAKAAASGGGATHLAEQLALLDTAHISTLHSFCFQLVSGHLYELGLDPQSRILPEEKARLLQKQTLDAVFDNIYTSDSPSALAIQKLVQAQGGDWDLPVRELILRLYHYSQTLRDPAAWFAEQTARFEQSQPEAWLRWLDDEMSRWRDSWLAILAAQPHENKNAARCAEALRKLPEQPTRAEFAAALEAIARADETWPRPKAPWREPIEKIFDEAEFLHSVVAVGATDPLLEDWQWARAPMLALLDLAGQFGRAYQDAKRHAAGLDYHDLEQFALRLLWKDGQPTEIAKLWRAKLRLIFVDEYQDINEAQESIIKALGREGAEANRFLVGDVKQSIYGFRLADPRIFSRYHTTWQEEAHADVIPLTENFRSHEAILGFVNVIFARLMSRDTGGIPYDEDAALRFGDAAKRAHLKSGGALPPVELHLRCGTKSDEAAEAPDNASDAELEARMVGRRFRELKDAAAPVFERDGSPRAAQWSDMVVLLRSPRGKVEAYVKEFAQLGIPLVAARGGFYEALEVGDLLNMLRLLDNPLQDLPLLGVLRSPLVGLTPEELARTRLASEHGKFWTALVEWHKINRGDSEQFKKIELFLRRFGEWRNLSRHAAVSHCLERIIDETHYGAMVAAQERGGQKRANVERLLQLTRQFDAVDGQSLYRFLAYVEAQQEGEVDIEPAAAPAAEAVRLMSIHQSKGLEFPIVAVADLGKAFNFSDSKARVILDEEYGLCPQIQPPDTPQFYPSLPHWLAQRRQKQKTVAEEMRLLYVALTRAGQRLILAGTATRRSLEEKWPEKSAAPPAAHEILAATRFFDWLGPWFCQLAGNTVLTASGANQYLTWTLYEDGDERLGRPAVAPAQAPALVLEKPPELQRKLDWKYPFLRETAQPAKTSVTTIRRQLQDAEGSESFAIFSPGLRPAGRLGAADVGLAHHTFLQWADRGRLNTVAALKAEAERLTQKKLLTPEQVGALDFAALAAFWDSKPGRLLLERPESIQRELPFTARFRADELQKLGCEAFAEMGAEEFVIVQGVMDLVAILPKEIWLLDFKTDHFPAAKLPEKIKVYRPQIELYAEALERIYDRPVTNRWLHFLSVRHTEAL